MESEQRCSFTPLAYESQSFHMDKGAEKAHPHGPQISTCDVTTRAIGGGMGDGCSAAAEGVSTCRWNEEMKFDKREEKQKQ